MTANMMPNWLAKRAELSPDRIALADGETTWTFRELHERVRLAARKLYGLGIRENDFVAVLLTNSYRVPQIVHALQYLGAVTVLLNSRLAPPELAWQLTDSGCGVLIHEEGFSGVVASLAEGQPTLRIVSFDQLEQAVKADVVLANCIELDRVHTLLYTSGTTGHPKGVLLTNGNHWWSAMGSVLNLGLEANDKWLICVPLFHMSGLSILLRSVIYGIPAIIQRRFVPETVNRALREEGVTIVSVVSSMLARMTEVLQPDGYPDSFRCMLVGGGPVPENLLRECRERRIPVYQTYGLTETASQLVTLSPEYMDSKLGSAGKPLFPAELRIEKNDEQVKPGEVGEIVVRGPNVTQGYLHANPVSGDFRAGWFHTGDLGYVDEEGFLYVLDRRSDLIISGGENVYPAEIEAALCGHPWVAEAGVTGVPHHVWGQVPVACVVTKCSAAITEEELRRYCREQLAGYKCPSRIYFVEELPRNAANKLLRRKLIEKLP